MKLEKNEKVLFLGDSITASGRVNLPKPYQLTGYPKIIYDALADKIENLRMYNRGTGKDTTQILLDRTQAELDEVQPTAASLMIGINDVWRSHDSDLKFNAEKFYDNYYKIVKLISQRTDKIIVMEPFLVDKKDTEKKSFRNEVNMEIPLVRQIADEFRADYLPLDGIFAENCIKRGADFYSMDGVHVLEEGFKLIADEWIKRMQIAR